MAVDGYWRYNDSTWALLLPALLLGNNVVIMSGFDPKIFLELVQKEKCTHTVMVPVQFQMIMGPPDFADYDLSSMESPDLSSYPFLYIRQLLIQFCAISAKYFSVCL